jgi:hypothetical protein
MGGRFGVHPFLIGEGPDCSETIVIVIVIVIVIAIVIVIVNFSAKQ